MERIEEAFALRLGIEILDQEVERGANPVQFKSCLL